MTSLCPYDITVQFNSNVSFIILFCVNDEMTLTDTQQKISLAMIFFICLQYYLLDCCRFSTRTHHCYSSQSLN